MNANKQKTKMIGLRATASEVKLIRAVMDALKRKSYSDVIRFLFVQEAEKIFGENTPAYINK